MRKFRTVFMRGGTSKGCMFRKEDLPENRAEWDSIFLQAMGSPDPKQIDGLGGTAAGLNVNFLDPAGAKTGKLLPTGRPLDVLEIPGFGPIECSILDVSNPMVLVRAEDIGMKGTELPEEVNANARVCELLEKIRGTACVKMGLASDLADAARNQPGVPKVGFFTAPVSFADIGGGTVRAGEMDVCARVISVFKCHKACPLTAASAIAVACSLEGSLLNRTLGGPKGKTVRVGHPSGVMTMIPTIQNVR